MPKLSEFLFGKKDKNKQLKLLSPQQEELLALITEGLSKGQGPLSDLFGGFDQKKFEEGVTKPAMQNFQENILPQLQEKFIAGNQVLGSGMRRGQQKAATDLQSQLAQLMYQAQQQHQQTRLAGLQTGLNVRPFENLYKQGTTGAAQGFVQGVGQGLGGLAGAGIAG